MEGAKPAWYMLQTVLSSCSTSSPVAPLPVAVGPDLELVLVASVPLESPVKNEGYYYVTKHLLQYSSFQVHAPLLLGSGGTLR